MSTRTGLAHRASLRCSCRETETVASSLILWPQGGSRVPTTGIVVRNFKVSVPAHCVVSGLPDRNHNGQFDSPSHDFGWDVLLVTDQRLDPNPRMILSNLPSEGHDDIQPKPTHTKLLNSRALQKSIELTARITIPSYGSS